MYNVNNFLLKALRALGIIAHFCCRVFRINEESSDLLKKQKAAIYKQKENKRKLVCGCVNPSVRERCRIIMRRMRTPLNPSVFQLVSKQEKPNKFRKKQKEFVQLTVKNQYASMEYRRGAVNNTF